MTDEMYDSYQSFKSWHEDPDESHDLFYKMEMADLGLQPGAKILEVGFGEGRFLDFARRAGYFPKGVEIIPELISRAKSRGHDVSSQQLKAFGGEAGTFDLIAAIDVIEHLRVAEITDLFDDARMLLRDGGCVFLRLPNGGSPFSMPLYNSDVTHRMLLTTGSLFQICGPLGFELVRAGNPKRDVVGGVALRARRFIQFSVRFAIETIIGLAYFGRRVPLDPNLVVVFKKMAGSARVADLSAGHS